MGNGRSVFTRALASADTVRAPAFAAGVPDADRLLVADGSNGEDDIRGAVSTWYAVHLDVPTPARVYAAPAATMIITAGLGHAARRARAAPRARTPAMPDADSNPEDIHDDERCSARLALLSAVTAACSASRSGDGTAAALGRG